MNNYKINENHTHSIKNNFSPRSYIKVIFKIKIALIKNTR